MKHQIVDNPGMGLEPVSRSLEPFTVTALTMELSSHNHTHTHSCISESHNKFLLHSIRPCYIHVRLGQDIKLQSNMNAASCNLSSLIAEDDRNGS